MIKFRHRNCDKAFTPATFAYILPPAVVFEKMITEGNPLINFPFGATVLHKDDYYKKSVGRSKARVDLNKTISVLFYCERIDLGLGRTIFTLSANHRKCSVQLLISVNFKTAKVRLDHIELI